MKRTATTKTGRKDRIAANRLPTDSTPTRTMRRTPGDDQFTQFPRVDDTKRYAKVSLENDGNGKAFGAAYYPLEDVPADVVAIRVTFVRK